MAHRGKPEMVFFFKYFFLISDTLNALSHAKKHHKTIKREINSYKHLMTFDPIQIKFYQYRNYFFLTSTNICSLNKIALLKYSIFIINLLKHSNYIRKAFISTIFNF